MATSEQKSPTEQEQADSPSGEGSLIFISHDTRDAELAEAFGKLLKSVSAGQLRSFRSSDKKGKDGIEFGDEWYNRLVSKLQSACDVVCIFTERSVDRPWLLFEAGIAKGKQSTKLIGMALGVPLTKINSGPFFQFQNVDGNDEDDITKLIRQLAERVKNIELDMDVVKTQVATFRTTVDKLLTKLASGGGHTARPADADPMAKLIEEMKVIVRDLPTRVAEQMTESGDRLRRRRPRRLHPMMLEEMIHLGASGPGDLSGLLLAASLVRDDAPWLYEMMVGIYKAAEAGDANGVKRGISQMRHCGELMLRGPFREEFGAPGDKEQYMFYRHLPDVLESIIGRAFPRKKLAKRERLEPSDELPR